MSYNAHPSPVPQDNADDLPPPWIRQFDTNYNTFFYINPSTDPPTTSWTHPNLPAGQAAPEQVQAIQSQGSAVDYMNSASTDTPAHGPSTPGDQSLGQPGERGMGSNMAMNMLMGKMGGNGGHGNQGYGHSSGGGTAAMAGKLASGLLGVSGLIGYS